MENPSLIKLRRKPTTYWVYDENGYFRSQDLTVYRSLTPNPSWVFKSIMSHYPIY